jgi:hypothetical protein
MLLGQDPKANQAFHDSWKMRAGDLYSPTYVVNYLKAHAAQPEFSGFAHELRRVGESRHASCGPYHYLCPESAFTVALARFLVAMEGH